MSETPNRGTEMDAETMATFLGNGGTGVVSFAAGTDEPPYSIPVSYGYDAVDGTLHFRLAVGGEKSSYLDSPATFVTYDRVDGRWASVVAVGRLESVPDEEVDTEILDSLRRTEIPLVDVFDRTPRRVEFRFYALDAERTSGRIEAPPGA